MKNQPLIDAQALFEEARDSEHKEAYRILSRTPHCRIAVGTRVTGENHQRFFLEVLVYLCVNRTTVDLPVSEKELILLKKLKGRGYSLNCQYDNCISCEISLQPENLFREYRTTESTVRKIFEKRNSDKSPRHFNFET